MKARIDTKTGLRVVNLNRRKAIRYKCHDCSGWRFKEVADCQHTDCPLYPFRSGQGWQDAQKRAAAIRSFCLWCMNGQRYEIAKCSSPICPLYRYRQSVVDKSIEIIHQGDNRPHTAASRGETAKPIGLLYVSTNQHRKAA